MPFNIYVQCKVDPFIDMIHLRVSQSRPRNHSRLQKLTQFDPEHCPELTTGTDTLDCMLTGTIPRIATVGEKPAFI